MSITTDRVTSAPQIIRRKPQHNNSPTKKKQKKNKIKNKPMSQTKKNNKKNKTKRGRRCGHDHKPKNHDTDGKSAQPFSTNYRMTEIKGTSDQNTK